MTEAYRPGSLYSISGHTHPARTSIAAVMAGACQHLEVIPVPGGYTPPTWARLYAVSEREFSKHRIKVYVSNHAAARRKRNNKFNKRNDTMVINQFKETPLLADARAKLEATIGDWDIDRAITVDEFADIIYPLVADADTLSLLPQEKMREIVTGSTHVSMLVSPTDKIFLIYPSQIYADPEDGTCSPLAQVMTSVKLYEALVANMLHFGDGLRCAVACADGVDFIPTDECREILLAQMRLAFRD